MPGFQVLATNHTSFTVSGLGRLHGGVHPQATGGLSRGHEPA